MESTVSSTGRTIQLNEGWLARRNWLDWLLLVAAVVGTGFAWSQYSHSMDGYEKAILLGTLPFVVWLGWFWRPAAALMLGVAVLVLAAIGLYGGNLQRAEEAFLLKYFLSSQSAILWMCMLFFISTVFYWAGMFIGNPEDKDTYKNNSLEILGSRVAWAGVVMALLGSFVRWYESHHIGAGIGHIPVSNLYEVFVLFCWMTALFYLYYEREYRTRALGAFVMLIVSAAVGFLLWYALVREAHAIQPLVPALQSWWMKLHVPANFVGYGTFALAAMVAFAYLIKLQANETRWYKLAPLWLLGIVLCLEPIVFRSSGMKMLSSYWAVYFGVSALIVAGIMFGRRRIAARLPSFEVLDDVMYKSIAVGFAFFTVATVLGALWAAEAWGGYWSWDPKETWALIVWLNYASWLHMRLMKGLRGTVAAWWALAGLAVTTFAFIGVNMFLSGLHSYGNL